MRKIIIATALALVTATTTAQASDDLACTKVSKEHWLSVEQLKGKLGEQGYTVEKIEIEDDCAEAKVRDKDGKSAELYVDPATGDVVKKDD